MRNDGQQRRRRVKFVPGLEPGPAVIESELSFDDICERYLAARRAGAKEIEKVADQGSGNQAITPPRAALPDHEPGESRPRRRPGI